MDLDFTIFGFVFDSMSENQSSGLFGLNFGFPTTSEPEKPVTPTGNAVFGSGFGVDTTTGRNSAEATNESSSTNIFGLGFGFDVGTSEKKPEVAGNSQNNVTIFGLDFGAKTTSEPIAATEKVATRKPSMFLGMDLSVIGIELPDSAASTAAPTTTEVSSTEKNVNNTSLFGIDFSDPFKVKAAEVPAEPAPAPPVANQPAKRQSILFGIDFAPIGIDFGEASQGTAPAPAATTEATVSSSAPTTPSKAAVATTTTTTPSATADPAESNGNARRSSVIFGIDLGAIGMDFQNNGATGATRAESPPVTPPEDITLPTQPTPAPANTTTPFSPAPNSGLAFLNFGSQSMDIFDMKSPIVRR